MGDSWGSIPVRAPFCTILVSARRLAVFRPRGLLTRSRTERKAKSHSVQTAGSPCFSRANSPAAIEITGAAVLRARSILPIPASASRPAAHRVLGPLRRAMYRRFMQRRVRYSFIPLSARTGASSPSTRAPAMYGSTTPARARQRAARLPPLWSPWPAMVARQTQTVLEVLLASAVGMSPSFLAQPILCQASPYPAFSGSTCAICALALPLGALQQPRQFPSQATEHSQTIPPSVPMDGTSPSHRGPPTWCPETPTERWISSCATHASVFCPAAPLRLREFLSRWMGRRGTITRLDR